MAPADDPARPEEGRQPEGVWKTNHAGRLSRRNGKLHQLRARPGSPAPSPNFPAALPERASACPVFENQENATKISATTATSTVRVMKVSMAAVPNEA